MIIARRRLLRRSLRVFCTALFFLPTLPPTGKPERGSGSDIAEVPALIALVTLDGPTGRFAGAGIAATAVDRVLSGAVPAAAGLCSSADCIGVGGTLALFIAVVPTDAAMTVPLGL
jgi:hypothetical protein